MSDETPRFEQTFSITTTERGKVMIKVLDRINVDDVFVHLVNRQLFAIATGSDPGSDIPSNWIDTLIKTQYSAS